MKIHSVADAIHVDKEEGTAVDYYLFPEYEIHYNEVKPGVTQLWHHHPRISETLYIIDGKLESHWQDADGQTKMQVVTKGDVIEVEDTPHTFKNTGDSVVKFVVFRFVPDGNDKSEIIKNDKVLDAVK